MQIFFNYLFALYGIFYIQQSFISYVRITKIFLNNFIIGPYSLKVKDISNS